MNSQKVNSRKWEAGTPCRVWVVLCSKGAGMVQV